MEGQEAKKKQPAKSRPKKRKGAGPYPFEFRAQAVRMQLAEGQAAQRPPTDGIFLYDTTTCRLKEKLIPDIP